MFCNLPTNEIADGHLSWGSPGVQERIHALRWAEWYEDEEGFLYIVDEDADEWAYGPDNEMADRIAEALKNEAQPWELECWVEGLTHVSYVLRRFSPEDGFYHS